APGYPSSARILAKYPATVKATIPLGAIQPIKVFSCFVNSVPIVEIQIDKGRTTNNITITKITIGHENICIIVSRVSEAVNKINTVEVSKTDTSSIKSLIFPLQETFFFAQPSVSPNTVTASIPVSFIINSAKVKQISTNDNIIGDFKYSGKSPRLASALKPSPITKPKRPANKACPKKLTKYSNPNSARVNTLTTSYENKASSGPAGSTIIPTHYKTAAALRSNF